MNPPRHAYTKYTGKPYIYYAGVPITRNVTDNIPEHPNRSIVWPNLEDKKTIEEEVQPMMVDQTMYPNLYFNHNYSANNFAK